MFLFNLFANFVTKLRKFEIEWAQKIVEGKRKLANKLYYEASELYDEADALVAEVKALEEREL